MMSKTTLSAIALVLVLFTSLAWAVVPTPIESLGDFLYKDKNLSLNQNQSCKTCHHPSAGFADPENLADPIDFPVSAGSDPSLFGGRNAPSAAYAGFSPIFGWDDSLGGYVGGMFWDGRATGETLGDPLAEQALGPFLNPVEMAMPDAAAVVEVVSSSKYVDVFLEVFPDTDFSDVQGTYDNIGRAIAAFERSKVVTRFNSKFDQFRKACLQRGLDVSLIDTTTHLATLPQGILTSTQLQGLALFNDAGKGNCASCHPTNDNIDADRTVYPPLFTNYSYDNLGIPTNWRLYELAGGSPPDNGLGDRDIENAAAEVGKFKVPTLRNVAKSAPYGHNGYFPVLSEIVHFKNTRGDGTWEEPEVSVNMNTIEIGDLGLTRQEEWQIVSFLGTLTDQK